MGWMIQGRCGVSMMFMGNDPNLPINGYHGMWEVDNVLHVKVGRRS